MITKDVERRTLEALTALACRHRPDLLTPFGGLAGFVDWLRGLDCSRLYDSTISETAEKKEGE